MKRTLIPLFLLTAVGCPSAAPTAGLEPEEVIAQARERARPTDALAWPDEPVNGSPVGVHFQEIHKDVNHRRARLRLFNFNSEDITQVTMQLTCTDVEETPLPCVGSGTSPESWWTSSISLPGHGHGTHSVSTTLPGEVVHVAAEVHAVMFKNGKRWSSNVASQ